VTTKSKARGEPAAARLAEFCASIRWHDLDTAVQERAAELVLDHLGVAAGGSREPSTAPVLAAIPTQDGGGATSVA
jgi:2-methylcitrate dehydratase PrpD